MPSSTVSETFCKFSNVDIETMLEKDKTMSKGQAGLRPNRSCVDHMHILRKLIDGRKNARPTTCCFFLDRKKVFDKYGGMEEWVVEKYVGNFDRAVSSSMYRNLITQDGGMGCGKICWKLGSEEWCGDQVQKMDGMCEKCCDAGLDNNQIC